MKNVLKISYASPHNEVAKGKEKYAKIQILSIDIFYGYTV